MKPHTRFLASLIVLCASTVSAQEAPDPGRESKIDEGVLVISGRPGYARAEEFSIYKRPDGGFTVISNITADDDSFTATGTWNYDAKWRALSAEGQSTVKGVTRKLEIRREGGPEGVTVRLVRKTTSKSGDLKIDTYNAPCDMNCLMDLTPAALPMAVMPRRYDSAKGGEQTFKWVGISYTDDQVLLDGTATLWLNRTQKVSGVGDVSHWRFREDLPGPKPGETYQMNSHLWTDATLKLRKFGIGRTSKPGTIGIRETDEKLSSQMPAE